MRNSIKLIGAGIDVCAGICGASSTPMLLVDDLAKSGLSFTEILNYTGIRQEKTKLHAYFASIAQSAYDAVVNKQMPFVIGGDHSCAIGTWSGIAHALNKTNESLGLIWCDAHMDAHTPDTSPTGNIHGMPIATLLGYGYAHLTNILYDTPKIKPDNIVLIGIRSFESGEEALLRGLGVKIYYDYDLNEHGFANIFQQSLDYLEGRVDKLGLSIDVDGFDPIFAPGVGTLVPNGISLPDFLASLPRIDYNKLCGVEITEGNFALDNTDQTKQCILDIINTIRTLKS